MTHTLVFDLSPPFRLDLVVWALRRQPHNRIDFFNDGIYRRVFVRHDRKWGVRLRQVQKDPAPRIEAEIDGETDSSESLFWIRDHLIWSLGLDRERDMTGFAAMAENDPLLSSLSDRFRGLRPPRFPSLFETLVNAVACQQVTLHLGILLLGRLALACDGSDPQTEGPLPPFPTADALLTQDFTTLRRIGFSRGKIAALRGLAEEEALGRLDRVRWRDLPNDVAVQQLTRLRGIGRWSAEYALLRGLGRLDVFPGDDSGARKSLGHWLGKKETLDYEGIENLLRRWQPYAGLVYFYLLLRRLELQGVLPDGPKAGPKERRTDPIEG
jgi:DNA-3-methyladenine glycosylase II